MSETTSNLWYLTSSRKSCAISVRNNWNRSGPSWDLLTSFVCYVSNRDVFTFDIIESVNVAKDKFKRGGDANYTEKTRETCDMRGVFSVTEYLSNFSSEPIVQIYLKDQLKPWIKDFHRYRLYLTLIFNRGLAPELRRLIASFIGINNHYKRNRHLTGS
jgi:hypothetical protein